jgi:hypothetical protein
MENEKPYYGNKRSQEAEMSEDEMTERIWYENNRARTAIFNLSVFIGNMLANASVLSSLCGKPVFYGLNVPNAVDSIYQEVLSIKKKFSNGYGRDFETTYTNYIIIKHEVNTIYRLRRDVRVLAETVGLPTHKMTAEELLTYSCRR